MHLVRDEVAQLRLMTNVIGRFTGPNFGINQKTYKVTPKFCLKN